MYKADFRYINIKHSCYFQDNKRDLRVRIQITLNNTSYYGRSCMDIFSHRIKVINLFLMQICSWSTM